MDIERKVISKKINEDEAERGDVVEYDDEIYMLGYLDGKTLLWVNLETGECHRSLDAGRAMVDKVEAKLTIKVAK